jgi:hypothetical protein
MKITLLILIFCFNLSLLAQAGTYTRFPKSSDGTKIKWTLSLNPEGTFLYHFLRDLSAISKANSEENFYAKGTWKSEYKIVCFYSKPSDINDEFSVNLNNSKARYITKSPRDKSDNIVKTALLFYESETFHIKGLELFKE